MRRSFALRVAALLAGLVVLVCGAGFGWGYWRVEAALGAQLDASIAIDTEGYLEDFQALGPQGFAVALAGAARRRGALLLLRAPDGTPVAGRLDGAPFGLRGFATIRTPDGRNLRVLGAPLPGGLQLSVGADLAPVRRGAAALSGALPVAGALAAAAALALGFVAARRLERRLRLVSEAGQAVIAGDLSRRLPLGGRGDEFDRLAGTMNAVLARIETLVEGLQVTTVSIAHDLRGPLFRLRQGLEAATARPRAPDADLATLETALAELDGVLATFSALLRIGRAEAGVAETAMAPVDLSLLAGEVAEFYAAVAEEAGQSIEVSVRPGQVVTGDAALLRQIVANLLENALAHGGPGVRVTVSVERPSGGGPVLAVRDTGPGIPAAEHGRVLERFYRLDRSRTTSGNGLGLALVAAAARLHGAALRLEEAGPGLRVTLAFPATGPGV